ncbi:MAG: DNA polymerase III subunit epsilon [Hyphomicrobiaceae bacterium]|nr:DNA polymerase III subunit epsilon [Hyphomicrobiaceae bacterium]
MREIMLDTETTGLSHKEGDRIVEIGCVEMVNRFATGKVYHEYVNPQRDMPEPAFKVHGLSEEFLSDKPLFGDLADGFLEFIDGAKLIIHNASFDIGFLNFELEKAGRPIIAWTHVIDTLTMARQKYPGAANNLDALCRRFNIDNSSREKHGALLDSELLAEVYLELIGGHQAGLDLGAGSRSESEGGLQVARVKPRATPLPSLLTDEEREAHEAFIKTLGDAPLWHKMSSGS